MNRIHRPARFVRALAVLLAGVAANAVAPVPPAAAADNVPGKWSENKLIGFRFRPLNEWAEVPPGTDPDATEIGGFYSDKSKYQSNLRPSCAVYAFKREGRAVATPSGMEGPPTPPPERPDGPPDAEDMERMRREFMESRRKKNLEEVLEDERSMRQQITDQILGKYEEKKRKKIEQKGWKLPPTVKKVADPKEPDASITFIECESPLPLTFGDPETCRYLGAWIENDEYQVGVLYFLPGDDVKKYMQGALASLKTLEWLDGADIAAARKDLEEALAGANSEDERWVALLKSKVTPGWSYLQTRNYLLLYDKAVKPDRVKLVAVQIEAIRKDVYEVLFPPDRPVTAICVVRVCKDKEQYHQYGGPGGSAGYWNPGSRELVFYEDVAQKKDALRVLNHEAFHQYIHYSAGAVAPHSWFNEGHGDYFAGFNFNTRGKFVPAKFAWRADAKSMLGSGDIIPLKTFVRMTQQEYYGPRIGKNYSQGWAFIWFLRQQKNPEWKDILPVYFNTLKAEITKYVDEWVATRKADGSYKEGDQPPIIPNEVELNAMDAAVKAAFGEFDDKKWAKIEKEWKDFL
jgi:hypothetical protein